MHFFCFKPMKAAVIFLLVLSSVNVLVSAHSWLECTDYRIRNLDDMYTWDPSICFGRARCGYTQQRMGFGFDSGFNALGKTCQNCHDRTPVDIATYRPGQKVCLTYPPKTHVAATCHGVHINDPGVVISRSARGPPTDDVFVKTYTHMNGWHKFGVQDYKGYQNCPGFCENKGAALCTMCFKLEDDIPPGNYSFAWSWTPYRTCWDATVKA